MTDALFVVYFSNILFNLFWWIICTLLARSDTRSGFFNSRRRLWCHNSCHNKTVGVRQSGPRSGPAAGGVCIFFYLPHLTLDFTSIRAPSSTCCSCQHGDPPYHCTVFHLISSQRSPCIQTTLHGGMGVLSVGNLNARLPSSHSVSLDSTQIYGICCRLLLHPVQV